MEINNKIYKYMAIISFTIVTVLICNLILPLCSFANSDGEFFMEKIIYDETNKTLRQVGNTPKGYDTYTLYWAKGDLTIVKPSNNSTNEEKLNYITEMINWFKANPINENSTIVLTSNEIDSTINIPGAGKYYTLCVVDSETEGIMIDYNEITVSEKVVKEEVIENNEPVKENDNIDLLLGIYTNTTKLNIKAIAEKGNIKEVKYCITDDVLVLNNEQNSKANKEYIENNSTSLNVSNTSKEFVAEIDDAKIVKGKYINFYITTDFNNSKIYLSKPISGIQMAESFSWVEKKETVVDNKNEYEEVEDVKNDENNKEENKSEYEEIEETKKEENVIENSKQNEDKSEYEEIEEVKKEENNKQEDKSEYEEIEETKSEENKNNKITEVEEEPKKTNPLEQIRKDGMKILRKDQEQTKPVTIKPVEEVQPTVQPTVEPTQQVKQEVVKPTTVAPTQQVNKETTKPTTVEPVQQTNQETVKTEKSEEEFKFAKKEASEVKEDEDLMPVGKSVELTYNNKLPQAGSNDSFIIVMIVIFSGIGIVSFVKYRRMM